MSGGLLVPSIKYEIGELHNRDFVLGLTQEAITTGVEPFHAVLTLQGWEGRFGQGELTIVGIITALFFSISPMQRELEYVYEGSDRINGGLVRVTYHFVSDQGTAELLM